MYSCQEASVDRFASMCEGLCEVPYEDGLLATSNSSTSDKTNDYRQNVETTDYVFDRSSRTEALQRGESIDTEKMATQYRTEVGATDRNSPTRAFSRAGGGLAGVSNPMSQFEARVSPQAPCNFASGPGPQWNTSIVNHGVIVMSGQALVRDPPLSNVESCVVPTDDSFAKVDVEKSEHAAYPVSSIHRVCPDMLGQQDSQFEYSLGNRSCHPIVGGIGNHEGLSSFPSGVFVRGEGKTRLDQVGLFQSQHLSQSESISPDDFARGLFVIVPENP